VIPTLKDPVLLVQRREQISVLRHVLRLAKKQIATWAQRVVEDRDQCVLLAGVEVDQQIATRDQVDPRKRRVADQAMRGEDTHVPRRLGDRVGALTQQDTDRVDLLARRAARNPDPHLVGRSLALEQ
jgi:hypothetical protein